MSGELTWRKAINKVLESSPTPLHYNGITEQIISDGLRTNVGATPAATVNRSNARRTLHFSCNKVVFLLLVNYYEVAR